MIRNKKGSVVAAVAAAGLASAPALAEKASALTSINGMSAERAEDTLRARGFTYTDSMTNTMGYTYSYWWHSGSKNCVSVESKNRMVLTVNDTSAKDCHHSGGGDAAAAVGVVAGAAILGALLSHKSKHHDDGNHYADAGHEQQYDRGYNDGLHNAAYHNYDRSDQYSAGYQAGVNQRTANLGYHSGRGGYGGYVSVDDLNGARAAGGMDEMSRRGFRQVDNFATGNTRYSIQYRAASNQCVQVTIADGHFYDVRDIGSHPACR